MVSTQCKCRQHHLDLVRKEKEKKKEDVKMVRGHVRGSLGEIEEAEDMIKINCLCV